MITKQELSNLLEYDPETGIFKWKVPRRRGTIPPGARAGSDIGDGWVSIKIGGRGYYAARLAWWLVYDEYPEFVPVPLDGDRSNLAIDNLIDKQEYNKTRDGKFQQQITHEELLRILDYDPHSGVFTWKVFMGSRATVGSVAGTIQDGYTNIRIYGRGYKAARLAWLYTHGVWPEEQMDHIDRERSNNRLNNLRDVTLQVNLENRRPRKC